MTEEFARQLVPNYAGLEEEPVRIYSPRKRPAATAPTREKKQRRGFMNIQQFKQRYGVLLITAAVFTLYTIILSGTIEARTEKRVWAEAKAQYAAELEAYKTEQREAEQAEYWLSGQASFEAMLNQEIQAGAKLISQEANDQYKLTKLGVALARVMNPGYPGTMQEVANQPQQWLRYSPDNKVTAHDLELAEKILRPYYEQGIVPNGLTDGLVYFNTDTGVARDSWENTATMNTWRYTE